MQISSFNIYVADVLKHVDEASASNGGLPVFLFGHSMASLYTVIKSSSVRNARIFYRVLTV